MQIRNKISDMATKLRYELDARGIKWEDASDFWYDTYYDDDGHIHHNDFHCERTRFNFRTNDNGEEEYTSVVWNWITRDRNEHIGLSMGFPNNYEVWDKAYSEEPMAMSLEEIITALMDSSFEGTKHD